MSYQLRTLGILFMMIALLSCGSSQKKIAQTQTTQEVDTETSNSGLPKEEVDLFVKAARNGDLSAVKDFYNNHGTVQVRSSRGNTALMWAAQKGNLDIVRFLITAGANVNATDKYREEPVLMWATKKGNTEVVKLLLENNADINAGDKYKETPLMDAARYGHLDIVKMLIHHRATVNATSSTGESALMWAAANGHKEIVEFLITNGASINKINYQTGETALAKAKNKGYKEIVNLLRRQAKVEGDIIKRPVRPQDTDFTNEPPGIEELKKYWGARADSLPSQLSPKAITVHMNSFLPDISQCYQDRLNDGDKNLIGTMKLKARVAGNGEIVDIFFETEKYQASLFGDCILEAIKSKRFPMFHDGVMIFQYSYTL